MLDKGNKIHLIGIGGIGVSGVARALMARGCDVRGSDVRESQLTLALRDEGAQVTIGHDGALVSDVDLVVVSTAIPDTNPELVAARESSTPVWHRAEVLGAVLGDYPVAVGVIGTHGKGTVASAITWLLESAGREPSFVIGGLLENFPGHNARFSNPDLLVAEVDESDGSLRHVHPTLVVVNNLEADHLNYYDSLEHIQDTVVEALGANPRLERVILNIDDPGAEAILPRLQVPVTTFGRGPEADVRAVDIDASSMGAEFSICTEDLELKGLRLNLPGLYNLDNATGAVAAALALGVAPGSILSGLPAFKGLENRFTVVNAGGRRIIKDYISHPTGIRRVLEAAAADGRRITAVFKPYRFTMINYLQEDYAEAFHDADETVITDLYTAGEVPIPGIDTAFLCDKIRSRGPRVTYIEDMGAIVSHLHKTVQPGEQAIFFGGDDLFQLADQYVTELERAEA